MCNQSASQIYFTVRQAPVWDRRFDKSQVETLKEVYIWFLLKLTFINLKPICHEKVLYHHFDHSAMFYS
jgi:hypothetical protein